MEDNNNAPHCFEAAGLGRAPFRFIGMAERTFQAAPGEPVRAGGSCAFCFTGIRYAAQIASADGKVFDVGSDCVARTDPAIWAAVKAERAADRAAARAAARELARAAGREAAEARQKIQAAEMDEVEDEWRADHATESAWMDAATSSSNKWLQKAALKAVGHVRATGALTGAQRNALEKAGVEATCTGHVGNVGKREKTPAEGIYLGAIAIQGYMGAAALIVRIAVKRADGTWGLACWKTSGFPLQDPTSGDCPDLDEAHRITVKAFTVKSHGDYQGADQTWITRAVLVPEGRDASLGPVRDFRSWPGR